MKFTWEERIFAVGLEMFVFVFVVFPLAHVTGVLLFSALFGKPAEGVLRAIIGGIVLGPAISLLLPGSLIMFVYSVIITSKWMFPRRNWVSGAFGGFIMVAILCVTTLGVIPCKSRVICGELEYVYIAGPTLIWIFLYGVALGVFRDEEFRLVRKYAGPRPYH